VLINQRLIDIAVSGYFRSPIDLKQNRDSFFMGMEMRKMMRAGDEMLNWASECCLCAGQVKWTWNEADNIRL
jgi:hypothetical protein